MNYFGSMMSSAVSTVFIIFAIVAAGYLIGRIQIKNISLGTAGVLLAALCFGVFAGFFPYLTIGGHPIVMYLDQALTLEDGTVLSASSGLFSLLQNMGTAMFVTAIGLTAGPKFFRMFRRECVSYILIAVIIIGVGTLVSVGIMAVSPDENLDSSLMMGLMTGALTSTPGFSAAREVAADPNKVSAGYGIAYLFGVIGVVLFVQIIPRILKVDLEKERESYVAANTIEWKPVTGKRVRIDPYGFFVFALTVILGCLIGSVRIPGINFSLGTSGGVLIAGLLIGHFGHIGPLDCRVKNQTLVFLREAGLCFFLTGAGVPGGVNFISNVRISYFIYGVIITMVPMMVGYILAKNVFHLSIFNALGALTGGMTSTPALSALITVSGTDDVTNAYAASYPFALFTVVVVTRLIAGFW